MGQYYIIANIDKQEFLHPHKWNNGMKLMEFSYVGNYLSTALLNLMKGRWAGDRVYVIGDYADLSSADENWYTEARELYRELPGVGYLDTNGYERGLQDYIIDTFKHVPMNKVGHKRTTAHYVYNHRTNEVLCLDHVPTFHVDPDGWAWRIAPLNLLLAMGNGRGGGDYGGHHEEMVGSWVKDSAYLEVTSQPLAAHAMFKEVTPDFYEKW